MMPRSDLSRQASIVLSLAALPNLKNQEIMLYLPDRKTGYRYYARVLSVTGSRLRINLPRRLAGHGFLRDSTPIIAGFIIGNTWYRSEAYYCAEGNQVREVIITGPVTETTRRKYTRHNYSVEVSYAVVSEFTIRTRKLAHVAWKRTVAHDISAGGVLIQTHFKVQAGSYLLLDLNLETRKESLLVLGQVKWSGISDTNRRQFQCGVRFIPSEELLDHLSPAAMSALPRYLTEFNRNTQMGLEAYLSSHSGPINRGEDDNGTKEDVP